jgi:hypothetical protein
MFEAVNHLLFLSLSWHPIPGRLYCPVCISQAKPPAPAGWSTRNDVKGHLKVAHKWETPDPSDALSHQDLVRALMVWRRTQEEIADGFGDSLMLVRDVNDFLDECRTR